MHESFLSSFLLFLLPLHWARQLFLGIPPFISDPGNFCLFLDLSLILGSRSNLACTGKTGSAYLLQCNIKLAQKHFLRDMALELTTIKQQPESVNRTSSNNHAASSLSLHGGTWCPTSFLNLNYLFAFIYLILTAIYIEAVGIGRF